MAAAAWRSLRESPTTTDVAPVAPGCRASVRRNIAMPGFRQMHVPMSCGQTSMPSRSPPPSRTWRSSSAWTASTATPVIRPSADPPLVGHDHDRYVRQVTSDPGERVRDTRQEPQPRDVPDVVALWRGRVEHAVTVQEQDPGHLSRPARSAARPVRAPPPMHRSHGRAAGPRAHACVTTRTSPAAGNWCPGSRADMDGAGRHRPSPFPAAANAPEMFEG